jgi:hypothetical protein
MAAVASHERTFLRLFLQVELTCKCAGALVLKRMPTYAETILPLKPRLKGLQIDMHGCGARCRCLSEFFPTEFVCSEVTGRGAAGHVARIVQEQLKQPGADSKVMTFTEDWLQVHVFEYMLFHQKRSADALLQRGLQMGSLSPE